jgi:hypothetical protein
VIIFNRDNKVALHKCLSISEEFLQLLVTLIVIIVIDTGAVALSIVLVVDVVILHRLSGEQEKVFVFYNKIEGLCFIRVVDNERLVPNTFLVFLLLSSVFLVIAFAGNQSLIVVE